MIQYTNLKDDTSRCRFIKLTAGADITKGDVIKVANGVLVVAMETVLSGAEYNALVSTGDKGILVTKQAALAIAAGELVYWDTGADEADKTNTNEPMGYASKAAASGDANVQVVMVGPAGAL